MNTPAGGREFNLKEEGIYRFPPFELSPQREELRKHGVPVRLPPQPFQVLLALIENAGVLVTREELQNRVWGSGDLIVEFDAGLNRCIRQIRTALSDNADDSRFIKTEPRRGYRFIAPVERDQSPNNSSTLVFPTQPVGGDRGFPAPSFAEPRPASSTLSHSERVLGSIAHSVVNRARHWLFRRSVSLAIATAIAFIIFVSYLRETPARNQPVSFATIPLATGLGAQYSPALSPDGQHVAFTWSPSGTGNFDVYVKAIHGAKLLRLTNNQSIDYSPAWSPDGQKYRLLPRLVHAQWRRLPNPCDRRQRA